MNSSSSFPVGSLGSASANLTRAGREIVTFEDRIMAEMINCGILSTLICILGVIANMINIVVYFRQGLNSTINISFFALAISDLLSLLSSLWFNISKNPLLENADDINFIPSEIQYLTGGWPHAVFVRITSWITALVTAERSCSILLPLKVNHIFTPTRVALLTGAIYVLNLATLIPEYSSIYIGWRFVPQRNTTLLCLISRENRPKFEGLSIMLNALSGFVSFVIVIVCTLVLTFQLRQQTRWRMKSVHKERQAGTTSKRDRKVIAMVTIIAVIFIACFFPGVVFAILEFILPEVSIIGKDKNFYFVIWSTGFLLESVNASVNILFYYRMSSKYRQTCSTLICNCQSTSPPAG